MPLKAYRNGPGFCLAPPRGQLCLWWILPRPCTEGELLEKAWEISDLPSGSSRHELQERDTLAPFRMIKRTTNLYEEVVAQVKEAIFSGKYQAGEALPSEAELTRQLGVSRPVIREALRYLQSRGFLEIRRGTKGGAFVCDLRRLTFAADLADLIRFGKVSVAHLAQVRMFIEPEACRLAAVNAAKQDLLRMRTLLKGCKLPRNRTKADLMYGEFHRTVGRACGNPICTLIMESILDFTDGFIRTIRPVAKIVHRYDDHEEILLALESRDGHLAALAAARHAAHLLREMKDLEEIYLEQLTAGRVQAS